MGGRLLLKGVFTPAITIFDSNGRLDFSGNEKAIRRLIENGVNGILFLGSIGEFFNMTFREKKEFIDFAVKTVEKRVPVMIGTGGTVLEEVIELTRYAQKAGADYAVAISPYYFKLDEASVYRYYAAIAEAADLPLLLYNFPDRTAVDLSPQLVLKLAREYSNIVGIKDTVDNISHTRKLIHTVKRELPEFAVFSGFDEYLIPNLTAGGNGLIGGLSNLAPQLLVRIYQAFCQDDLKTVALLQQQMNGLMAIYDVSQPFVTAIKAAAALLIPGLSPFSRVPAGRLDAGQTEQIRDILKKAGMIE
jgi:4-hydroxy-tetrahydrodipicolinate synthase